MNWFKRRKIAKQLAKVGVCVDVSYLVYINNESPVTFTCREDANNYISSYRENTSIFKLQLYRIESYSL